MLESQRIIKDDGDRRTYPRKRVLWEAAIRAGASEAGCVLLNVSDGGALLRVADPFACPTTLDIEIARVGSFPAEVAWRGADSVGLTFKDSPREVSQRLHNAQAL